MQLTGKRIMATIRASRFQLLTATAGTVCQFWEGNNFKVATYNISGLVYMLKEVMNGVQAYGRIYGLSTFVMSRNLLKFSYK